MQIKSMPLFLGVYFAKMKSLSVRLSTKHIYNESMRVSKISVTATFVLHHAAAVWMSGAKVSLGKDLAGLEALDALQGFKY